jgi:hypothetical protein
MWLVVVVGVVVVVVVVVVIGVQGGSRPQRSSPMSARNAPAGTSHSGAWRSSDGASSYDLHHDRDGTPFGAIEDALTDSDGDGEWDDFDGDGMPDW